MGFFDFLRNPDEDETNITKPVDQPLPTALAAPAEPDAAQQKPGIDNPMVRDYITKLYGDKFSDSAREKLQGQIKDESSGPNFRAGLAALGAGLSGRDAAAAGMGFLDRQKAERDKKLTDFDEGRKALVGNQELGMKLRDDQQTQDNLAKESDPNSDESRVAQNAAIKMGVPKELAAKLTAKSFKAQGPAYELMYKVDQDRLKRQDELTAKKLERDAKKEDGLTSGQKAVDQNYAKEYNDWTSTGKNSLEKNLQLLEGAKAELAKRKNDWFGTSGRIAGRVPDILSSNDSIKLRQDVQQAAQGALRATLGSQFTEKEGERIMKNAYDENLSPEQNIAKIDTAIQELRGNADNADSKARQYEQSGSLRNYKSVADQNKSPDPVRMIDPKGQVRLVPKDKVKDAIAAGGKLADPTSAGNP